ncbi:hypothetical protein D1007_42897 [Hordeum vulgare]|nr:hypothetical protein D1007_42897 [Hordeum vulgare]
MGRTCVYVHHVDKDAFLKGNIDLDPDELDMVFDLCPSYGELLEQIRKDLNWMDPSDVVEFDGRHNVGFGMHIRWKTMRVNSEQRWLAYKDTVAESLDKALELFAIKTNVPNLLDLNRVSSPIVEAIPAPINEEANIEPLSCVDEANEEVNIEHEPLVEANDEHDDDENDGNVLHDNNLGDLDKYNLQETMDHSIPYSRGYASESDDEGPDEEVDEEGFTAKEAEAFTKLGVVRSSVAGLAGVVGLVVGVISVGVVGVVPVGVVSIAVADAVDAGTVIWFKIRPRSAKYHTFTCSFVVDMSASIKNVGSVFLFFAATLVLRRLSLTCRFAINAGHHASDFSSLLAALLLALAVHCSGLGVEADAKRRRGSALVVAETGGGNVGAHHTGTWSAVEAVHHGASTTTITTTTSSPTTASGGGGGNSGEAGEASDRKPQRHQQQEEEGEESDATMVKQPRLFSSPHLTQLLHLFSVP